MRVEVATGSSLADEDSQVGGGSPMIRLSTF